MSQFIKISAQEVTLFPAYKAVERVNSKGESYTAIEIDVPTTENVIKKHCVENMISTLLGFRPIKNNQELSSVLNVKPDSINYDYSYILRKNIGMLSGITAKGVQKFNPLQVDRFKSFKDKCLVGTIVSKKESGLPANLLEEVKKKVAEEEELAKKAFIARQWVSDIADSAFYCIESNITVTKKFCNNTTSISSQGDKKMLWDDLLSCFGRNRDLYIIAINSIVELTGESVNTKKISFEDYADKYIRSQIASETYSEFFAKKQEEYPECKTGFTKLINQIRKYDKNDKSTGKQTFVSQHSININNMFKGEMFRNIERGYPEKVVTFDVSFYIPVDVAEQIFSQNKDYVNNDKSFVETVLETGAVKYLGSGAVVSLVNSIPNNVHCELRYVKDGSTL